MEKIKRHIKLILSGVIFTVVALGMVAFCFTSNGKAATQATDVQTTEEPPVKGGFPRNPGNDQKYLAAALGITEEELQAAQQEAMKAEIQDAVEQGLITQEQADEMLENGRGFHGFGFGKRGDNGENTSEEPTDPDSYLAEALGITVEELKAAREEARQAMLEEAIANGEITQEQVDLMEIRQSLSSYLNPMALQAEALGITEDELKAYRDERKSMEDILTAAGLTTEEYQEALQTAYEAAIAQAVSDGVITQEQADLFLANNEKGMPGLGFGPGRGGPPSQNSDDANASSTPVPGQEPPAGIDGFGPGGGNGGFGPGGGPGGFGPGPFGERENPNPTPTESSTSGTNS